MRQPTPPLALSSPERTILEAVVVRQEIALRVRKRARVVLRAADGVANQEIGQQVGMARARVIYWRQRFAEQGIRGLWDVETVPPKERVPEAVELAVVDDCLFRPRLSMWLNWDLRSFNWNVRNLALRHGISRASVQRIWKKYGIKMLRFHKRDQGIDLQQWKISPDPLFGLTVYAFGGLFYESLGPVLVFCSRERPFEQLTFASLSAEARQDVTGDLVARFRNLEKGVFGRLEPPVDKFIQFIEAIVSNPKHKDAQIHLLLERHGAGVHARAKALFWLADQPNVWLHYTPWKRIWSDLVECWLRVIAAWPLQESFVSTAYQICQILREIPKDQYLDTLVIY